MFESYEETSIYHAPLPRLTVPRERDGHATETSMTVVDDTSVILTLPPTYGYVIRNSDQFPEPGLADRIDMPPPTYEEVMQMLGTTSIQHI